jgi:diketogulonate reductase-like aldo/keto reductase
MKRLGIDVLDFYLVHWPMPTLNKFVDTFTAFAHLRDQGRIRSIGVSNFQPEHINALVDATWSCPPSTRSSCIPGFRNLSYGTCTPASEPRPRRGAGSGRVRC